MKMEQEVFDKLQPYQKQMVIAMRRSGKTNLTHNYIKCHKTDKTDGTTMGFSLDNCFLEQIEGEVVE